MNTEMNVEELRFRQKAQDLQGLISEFLSTLYPLFDNPITDDGVGSEELKFMTFVFLPEQVSYLESLLSLCEEGPKKSIGLIGRSMLEGMIQLRWATTDPIRSEKWMAFGAVHDWKLLNGKKRNGEVIDFEFEQRLKTIIKKHEDTFVPTSKKSDESWANRDLARNWHDPKTIFDMFNEIGESRAYDLYREESQRTHWEITAFARYFDRSGQSSNYRLALNGKDTVRALAMGVIAALDTTKIANEVLGLGAEGLVDATRTKYDSIMTG